MAITQLQTHFQSWKNNRLVEVLFETEPPRMMIHPYENVKWVNQGLNKAQKEAIQKSLISQDIAMIHGPPGTGKTTTVVEYII
jgi:flagellar biosynthesis GTPase FlhF